MEIRNKILIVDDESHGRQLLEAILIEEDYELMFADDGPKAMSYLHGYIPDLIVLDVMMPEMDGFEVCRKIRNDQRLKGIPIILVTALDDRDSRKKGLAAGANDYISKPFDRNEIQAKIRNLIRLNSAKPISAGSGLLENNLSELSDLSTLIEQVSRLLVPFPDYLRQNFQDFFTLSEESESNKTCIPWIHADKENIYVLLMKSTSRSLEDKMLNLLIVTFISRMIQTKYTTDSIDIINKLNIFLSNNLNLSHATLAENIHSLSVVILEKVNRQIHATGFNQSIIILDGEDVKKIDLTLIQHYPDINQHFDVISHNISETPCVYLSTIPAENLFDNSGSRESSGKSYLEFFGRLTSLTMNEQKLQFEKLLENKTDILSGEDGFEILGLRI